MKTILITGINGFLGSNLAKRFSKNFNIIGTEFSLENLERIKDFDFPIYLSNPESIQSIFNEYKIDIVIHTATFYGRAGEEDSQIIESNLANPIRILNLAIKSHAGLFINTDTVLKRFSSSYALTKKQFKEWLRFRSNEIKSINIKLEHFYGPGASNTNFINGMIEKLQRNVPSIDLTLGEQKRDFVFYEDVMDAYEILVNANDKLHNKFSQFGVCTGNLISIRELMLKLKEMTHSQSILNFGAIPYRENELMESKSRSEKLAELGWKPKVKIQEGLLKTINKYVK